MSEYIVSDKWLQEFEDGLEECIVDGHFEYIGATNPTPPLRPIVRCRDCRHNMAYWKSNYCDKFAHSLPKENPDGFCAWGERRDA